MRQFFLFIIALYFNTNLFAINALPPEKPSIIVNLVLDNVSNEDIDQYSHLLSENGLLKLRNEGSVYNNVFYPYSSNDRTCDYASISTGTTPRYHGIVAKQWYNADENNYQSAINLTNKTPRGNANNLIATTIGDELKLNTLGKSKVFSISLDKTAAILLAGHAADGTYWLDEKTGRWTNSKVDLKENPEWVNRFNSMKFPAFYLEQEWVMTEKVNQIYIKEEIYTKHLFPLTLKNYANQDKPFNILKSTPMGYLLIEDFTKEIVCNENLGQDQYTDLLYINLSSISDARLITGKNSLEKIDLLVKMDKSIANIIDILDKEIGTHRYLIALTSTKHIGHSVEDLKNHHLPTGRFNPERAKALLNSYLMATHGQGNWVINISNQQIYLNRNLIEKSHLDFNDFTEQVAQFMEEFSGIQWALPSYKLKYANFTDIHFMAMQASYFPRRCGDIMLCYFPGWAEESSSNPSEYTYSNNNTSVPLMFYGWKTKRSQINSKLNITSLAPTLSTLLRISTPNSSSENLIFDDLTEK